MLVLFNPETYKSIIVADVLNTNDNMSTVPKNYIFLFFEGEGTNFTITNF